MNIINKYFQSVMQHGKYSKVENKCERLRYLMHAERDALLALGHI